MKDISSVESLTIPEGVTVAIKSRIVTVEGPRGKLVKNVGHVQMDIQLVSGFNHWARSGEVAHGHGMDIQTSIRKDEMEERILRYFRWME